MELERIGFIPRSILRMLDRFYHQLSIGTAEPLVKQFRFSKYLLLTSVKSLLILLFVPLLTNFITKSYVFRPLIEVLWDKKQTEIFLNFDLQERAFYEIKDFQEKIYFESLVKTNKTKNTPVQYFENIQFLKKENLLNQNAEKFVSTINFPKSSLNSLTDDSSGGEYYNQNRQTGNGDKNIYLQNLEQNPKSLYTALNADNFLVKTKTVFVNTEVNSIPDSLNEPYLYKKEETLTKRFFEKTVELAEHYNHESQEAITNLLADLLSLSTLCFLIISMRMSIMNTTAFLFESFFSLKDSKKSFIMLLFTDLLVGFHSPRGWEVIFHSLFEHFGLPENQNIILLLVGSFPVLLDALFKYWIFRHLNRHSPATVATYQSMVE